MAARGFDKPVLIAGGGIGGLASALSLAERGIPCHVLEGRDAFSEDGAGIQIGPNGTRVLQRIGAVEHLKAGAAMPGGLQVFDAESGARLTRLPLGTWIADRFGAPYWTAHRQDLHRALLTAAESSGGIQISKSADVTGAITEISGGVRVRLGDRREIEGAALIAADGIRSRIRSELFGGGTPVFAGKCAFRSVVPAASLPAGLDTGDVHIWLAHGAHVVHYPVRGGHEIAIVVIVDEAREIEGWSIEVAPDLVRAKVSKLAVPLRDLIAAAAPWRMWSLIELAMPAKWSHGSVALLGDAAHPVLPFLAQGAVMALEDAVTIADVLADGRGGISDALSRYGAFRRARVLRVQSASRRNGRLYHLDGAFARARNAVLRFTPARTLMTQYDWLYGWTLEKNRSIELTMSS